MIKLATTDPKELRPLLHERIDKCNPEELEAVRKTLLMLEARRLADELAARWRKTGAPARSPRKRSPKPSVSIAPGIAIGNRGHWAIRNTQSAWFVRRLGSFG